MPPPEYTGAGKGAAGDNPQEGPSTPPQQQQQDQPSQYSTPATSQRATGGYGTVAQQESSSRSRNPSTGVEVLGSSLHGSEGTSRPRGPAPEQTPLQPPQQPTQRPGKPTPTRRSSSRYQAPHKGQEFSVDDDPEEYESDIQYTQPKRPTAPKRQSSMHRRRPPALTPNLARVDSLEEDEDEEIPEIRPSAAKKPDTGKSTAIEGTVEAIDHGQAVEADADVDDDDDDEDDDVSDAESFTLKDRQTAINQTHPFGIRIWKPAIYKKNRSIEKNAEGDIHSSPGGRVNRWLWLFNLVWTLAFGWWLALVAAAGAMACVLLGFTPSGREYGRVLWGLAGYLFYPFGKFVKLHQDEAYAEEDEGEGRSITEYEQWQSGDLEDGRLFFGPTTRGQVGAGARRGSMDDADETDSLLGHARTGDQQMDRDTRVKRRLFGRGHWTWGRALFFVFFYFLIAPLLLIVSALCWFMVFWIPMGRVTALLFDQLRRHPLALSFHSDAAYSRGPSGNAASILICTYRAVGSKYWKYTVDGTNIFFINLIAVVVFIILDYFVLYEWLGIENFLTHPGFVFIMALFSVIPLAYFIGQAVASISAQSSMGVGAAINAFFATVVEVFLYCVALQQGKAPLVEGSIIGSVFAGILFLPGISMCFGAIHRKTQRFNIKSAGVTSTMLLFAVIAAFGPTLFYQIYGSHELRCQSCTTTNVMQETDSDCRRCYYTQVPAINDRFFIEAVRPYCWFAAFMLFLSYLIGLWFTLRTHAAVIWNNEPEEKKTVHVAGPNGAPALPAPARGGTLRQGSMPPTLRGSVRDTQLYKRILNQSLKQIGMNASGQEETSQITNSEDVQSPAPTTPFIVPPKTSDDDTPSMLRGLSAEQNLQLARQIAELAATAATVAAHDPHPHPPKKMRSNPHLSGSILSQDERHRSSKHGPLADAHGEQHLGDSQHEGGHEGGGHDAPNWSRMKSSVILLGATLLYAIIAEILVSTVDVVLQSVEIDEKFLGITLFALVPNTTEFLNAISFAMNGNIALSMEIGSAYALQVCLLQVPALVLFSAFHSLSVPPEELMNHSFNLLFPQWDMVTVILCVFLFSYVYGEGKSNYFKGSILCLTYFVIVVGFYLSGLNWEAQGIDRFELVGSSESARSFKTIGRSSSGQAF